MIKFIEVYRLELLMLIHTADSYTVLRNSEGVVKRVFVFHQK